jgi:hypothetical protein
VLSWGICPRLRQHHFPLMVGCGGMPCVWEQLRRRRAPMQGWGCPLNGTSFEMVGVHVGFMQWYSFHNCAVHVCNIPLWRCVQMGHFKGDIWYPISLQCAHAPAPCRSVICTCWNIKNILLIYNAANGHFAVHRCLLDIT